ncbi:MAG: SPFH domain-containing protein [Planctomycetes bacterium]|nr:SPFH domain-containing protein [Planctomycetota bacterium]
MGIFDKLRGEFVDIIEWTDDSNDTMVYRFPRHNNEIKMGAKLTVRPGQVAVFINKGKIADVFEPDMYTLATDNMPILSTLKGWKHGFHSPFKAEVYFVSTRRFTDLKWGTKHPIMLRDAEFGPIRIRAFGSYVIKVSDAAKFITEIVGTDGHFTKDEITDQLRNLIVSRFADIIGESKIPVLDMAANYDELGEFITKRIHEDFLNYGLDIMKMLVENISLPKAVEEALDKRSSMGIIGNLNQYTQFQTANAMEDAAKNPGGMAAGGMGMGMGFAMANQMGNAMPAGQQQQPPQAAPQSQPTAPPPLPQAAAFHIAISGQQSGPFDMKSLGEFVTGGQVKADTLVWKQGMAQWTAAGQVPELSSLFGAAPPPLPPQ